MGFRSQSVFLTIPALLLSNCVISYGFLNFSLSSSVNLEKIFIMAFKKESNEIMRKEYIKQKPGTIALGGETGHNNAMLELGHHREQGFFREH